MTWTPELVRLRSTLVFACAAALLTVACGQGNSLSSPTAPSGTLSGIALPDGGSDAIALRTTAEALDPLAKGGNGGGVLSGFVTAMGTNLLTVRGITVVINDSTRIRHGNQVLTILDIVVGDHVQVRGQHDGNNLVATEIKVEHTGEDIEGDDDAGEGPDADGPISDLSGTGSCPALTFKVGNTTVTTGASTMFSGVTCADLANGTEVEIEGTRQANGSIAAAIVRLD